MMMAPGNSLGLRPVEMSCQSSVLTVPLLLEYVSIKHVGYHLGIK